MDAKKVDGKLEVLNAKIRRVQRRKDRHEVDAKLEKLVKKSPAEILEMEDELEEE